MKKTGRRPEFGAAACSGAAFNWVWVPVHQKEKPHRLVWFLFCGRYRTRIHYSVDSVKPESNNCPPGSCIKNGSRPMPYQIKKTIPKRWGSRDDIGLEYVIELPPPRRRQATVHRTVAFRWVRVPVHQKEKPHHLVWFLFGGRYRTRTYDLPHVKRML